MITENELLKIVYKHLPGKHDQKRHGRRGANATKQKYKSVTESGGKKLKDQWDGEPRNNKNKAINSVSKIPSKYTEDLSIDFVHPDANIDFYMPKQKDIVAGGIYNQSAKYISVISNKHAPEVFQHEVGHHLYNTLSRNELDGFLTGIRSGSQKINSTFLNVQVADYHPAAKLEEWFCQNVVDYFRYGKSYDPNVTDIMKRVISGTAKRG